MKIVRYTICYLLSLTFLLATSIHALDSEGNVSVAGFVETDLDDLRDTLFSVMQYNPSGQINTFFGDKGLATLPFRHGIAMNLAIDPADDSIIVVGTAIDPAIGLPRAIGAKFDSDGNLIGSKWLADAPSVANDIFITSTNPEYIICGSRIVNGRYRGFRAIIDPANGMLSDYVDSDPDIKLNAIENTTCVGKIITNGTPRPILLNKFPTPEFIGNISGEFLDISLKGVPTLGTRANDIFYLVGTHAHKGLLVKMLNPSSIDTSFGSNGYVIAEFGNKQTTFNAVKVDSTTERIFVCGTARSLQSHMFVAEYDTSGNLVPTFGNNGVMTIFEGPNVQTIARDLALAPSPSNFFKHTTRTICPSGSLTGMFALGSANGRTPLLANLNCSDGSLKTAYGDKAIASLETEELTAMTILKEVEPSGDSLATPTSSPFAREFNALFGNPFAVSLSGSGTGTGFVLQPGRYYIDAQAPLSNVSAHKLTLYNTFSGINEIIGDSIWNSSGILTKALLKGQLFISKPTKYILRHYFGNTGIGFSPGLAASFSGLEEVYAQMNIQQL